MSGGGDSESKEEAAQMAHGMTLGVLLYVDQRRVALLSGAGSCPDPMRILDRSIPAGDEPPDPEASLAVTCSVCGTEAAADDTACGECGGGLIDTKKEDAPDIETPKAVFVSEVTAEDPDSRAPVSVSIYKHRGTGGMFGVDSSYLEQCFDDDDSPIIPDPFCDAGGGMVELIET